MRLSVLFLLVSLSVSGQRSLFDALSANGDTPLVLLETDWDKMLQARTDKVYQEVTLTVNGHRFPGRVRTRGHARLRTCLFPSLRVKLNKKVLAAAGYSSLNDLKFGLQCNASKRGLGYLQRERLLYDLYAMVSPYHLRTLSVRVVIEKGDTLAGFLIESEEQLAARYDATDYRSEHVSTRGLDRMTYARLCLFNYLILNTDWNIYNLHNVACLRSNADSRLFPLPYDFDHSGLVDTHYAVPREDLGMTSVYEPRFLGRHLTEDEMSTAARSFLEKADELHQRILEDPDLDRVHRRQMIARLTAFMDEISDPDRLARLVAD
ncbi:hypothetical protein CLV84_3257 [Neolewinella xylanilytica]|uniref:CotH protein n=1 Tax=Neolewinella xylanilytica TaxID=1514080 RepID=A0A2S6I5H0_9BACT|nr:hypothetical protein [Neolewinella xylanilytica]PPK86331.1 hypothetical protein CLV84_3257 [Neolewinella xylanilytica]